MAETGQLQSLSRAALQQVGRLVPRCPDRLFGLSLPHGGLEWSQTPWGEAVLWVYSSVRNLVESCGTGQPWVRLTLAELIDIEAAVAVPMVVALDVRYPEGARYPEVDPRQHTPLPHRERVVPPDTVWVPARPPDPLGRRVEVELRHDSSGNPMLLVFSSIKALRAGCGPYQVAVEIRIADIARVVSETGAGSVACDMELPEELRHHASQVDWTRSNRFGW